MAKQAQGYNEVKLITKHAPEWVRTRNPYTLFIYPYIVKNNSPTMGYSFIYLTVYGIIFKLYSSLFDHVR